MRSALTLIALAGFCTANAKAAYPLFVDDAGVTAPRSSQWDFFVDGARSENSELLAGYFSIATGVCQRLEVSLGGGYGWQRDRTSNAATRDGVLDLNAGFKAAIWDETHDPLGVTISVTTKIPTASAHVGLGSGFTDLNALMIVTRTWGSLSLDLNAGYTWTAIARRQKSRSDTGVAGLALRYQANRLLLFAESFALLPTDSSFDDTVVFRAGGQYQLSKDILIGAAIGTGTGHGAIKEEATIGLTLLF